MPEDLENEAVFDVPKAKFYLSGVLFTASVFMFFVSFLSVIQLYLIFPEPQRTAGGLRKTYFGFIGLSLVALAASGSYIGIILSKGIDPK